MTRTSLLAVLLVLAIPASAGVNAGGVLAAHDAGLLTSATTTDPLCAQGTSPSNVAGLDTRIDGAVNAAGAALIKIFAIWPAGSHPQLSGVSWGVHYGADVSIEKGWSCGDFELPDAGWPGSDQGNSVTFIAMKTDLVVPIYVFSAYTTGTAATLDLRNSPTQGGDFGDDTVPAVLDPIAAYGKIGFDMNGHAPPDSGEAGACCDRDLGTCSVMGAGRCGTANIYKGPGTTCAPYPCGTGACCLPGGQTPCQEIEAPDACAALGGYFRGLGTACTPPYNDCLPYGACCSATTCALTTFEDCAYPSIFLVGWACSPDLCCCGLGACCGQTDCTMTTEAGCGSETGIYMQGVSCAAHPCSCCLGACCTPTSCMVTLPENCPVGATSFYLAGVVDCSPNPCPDLGACCYGGETNACAITTEGNCPRSSWLRQQPCDPDVCALPVERTTWGRIKARFKDGRP